MRDHPADRHSRARVEQRQHRVENRPADILEIDADAVRAGRLQVLRKTGGQVRDTGVVAKRLHHVTALLLAPGDAHHATALQSRELPGDLTHAAGRRRNDRRVTGLRLALQDHAGIGGQSKHSENAHGVADFAAGRIELAGDHIARPGNAFPHQGFTRSNRWC